MNQPLADKAISAITDPAYVSTPGCCEMFAREVCQAVYGVTRFDFFRGSAQESGLVAKSEGLAVAGDPQVGDLLYLTGFYPGHVGIYTGPDRGVAENSSTRIGRVQGAKGYRSLDQFLAGRPATIIRLPDATPIDIVRLDGEDGGEVCEAPVVNGEHLVPIREWADFMGFDLEGTISLGWTFDGQQVPGPVTVRGDHAYAPLRGLVAAAGLQIISTAPGLVEIGK